MVRNPTKKPQYLIFVLGENNLVLNAIKTIVGIKIAIVTIATKTYLVSSFKSKIKLNSSKSSYIPKN